MFTENLSCARPSVLGAQDEVVSEGSLKGHAHYSILKGKVRAVLTDTDVVS